ncbi:hypothetical protein Rhe02_55750 [Rhizocola hellebori]|uniref:Uncharacterized protein n=1 Tax=Rhizocola hellebori TaxID=1392758 RepID=A0A8J3QD51_9ACTN|nr:hypothetical protein Rhe02_55750 [Rhizocola hellebori]
MGPRPKDWELHQGDYVPWGEQGIKLVPPEACYRGHPIEDNGWGRCPRCRKMTTKFSCRVKDCDGARTTKAHNIDCPPEH